MNERASLEEAEIAARDLARSIKNRMPKGWVFFVILSSIGEIGEKGLTTYLSSCDRASAIKMLREMADHLEERHPEI